MSGTVYPHLIFKQIAVILIEWKGARILVPEMTIKLHVPLNMLMLAWKQGVDFIRCLVEHI